MYQQMSSAMPEMLQQTGKTGLVAEQKQTPGQFFQFPKHVFRMQSQEFIVDTSYQVHMHMHMRMRMCMHMHMHMHMRMHLASFSHQIKAMIGEGAQGLIAAATKEVDGKLQQVARTSMRMAHTSMRPKKHAAPTPFLSRGHRLQ